MLYLFFGYILFSIFLFIFIRSSDKKSFKLKQVTIEDVKTTTIFADIVNRTPLNYTTPPIAVFLDDAPEYPTPANARIFRNPIDLAEQIGVINVGSELFIDSFLGDSVKGEEIALILHKIGFKKIAIITNDVSSVTSKQFLIYQKLDFEKFSGRPK